jgi:hypothetical protein
MTTSKTMKTALIWLPTIPVVSFFIQNAFDKIINSSQSDKFVSNSSILILTGVVLLVATGLFLYEKTIIIGTAILAIYMTIVVFVHINKGKPFVLTIMIVLLTIVAGYIRTVKLDNKKSNGGQHKL